MNTLQSASGSRVLARPLQMIAVSCAFGWVSFFSPAADAQPVTQGSTAPALVIHGGAGTIERSDLTPEERAAFEAALRGALRTGYGLLRKGATALDVVEATIQELEDSPLFNAGKGAVFTADGKNELDASIMNGATLEAGAVAGVTAVKNPIRAARAVMEQTQHVMLSGPGADAFAEKIGLEKADPDYFYTERRWRSLERARERERSQAADASTGSSGDPLLGEAKFGTVGAVALDREGKIAAGTSTGGMTNKRHGRIGDSPVIGAGTYANASCGVSATGHGEYFIRHVVAHDICQRMSYQGLSLREAAKSVIHGSLLDAGGAGGIIALDSSGDPVLEFNTPGMYRGWVSADGTTHVAIFGSEADATLTMDP